MKKIIAASLIALATSSAFANVITKDITSDTIKANPTVDWAVRNVNDIYYINNLTDDFFNVFIRVRNGSQVNDPTTVTCGDKSTVLLSGSSVVCKLVAGTSAQIQVKPEQFKNGSEGNYAVVKI